MSFDDYVNHITQKFRLATAIAVLRSKPENISIDEYIGKLRENIDSMDYDSDVTICSGDFDVDSDIIEDIEYDDNKHSRTVIDNIAPEHNTNITHNRNNVDNSQTNNNQVTNEQHLYNEIHNSIIGCGNIDSQPNSNRENDYMHKDKASKVAEYVEILQELKKVDNVTEDMPAILPQHRISNPQTQDCIEDVDSDVTYCESIPYTQSNKNNSTLEETQIYSLSDFTPFYTHYSESQVHNITIEPKMIHKNRINLDNTQFEYSQNAQSIESLNIVLNQNTVNPKSKISDNDTNFANDTKMYANDKNTQININNDVSQSIVANDTNLYFINKDTSINVDYTKSYPNNNKYDNDTNAHNITNDTNTQNVVNDDIQSNDSNDLTDSQRETVPFKVIEELNKIKTYLKKRNDRRMSCDGSSDSGYRSDNHGRNSRNSLQISGACINQSAHSLLTYIITCSLSINTYDITKEVSRALGSLIDKLHEEEIYPSFLEVLLETITQLLSNIYEEDDCNCMLLSKDEKVQRVLLLNKSTHVQKYTIDKITNILETIDTEANETTHTAKMENLCYIFHILEIILSKHKIEQNSQSQESQEKVLKKSSITDIWRKKWNLSNEVVVENVEKKCALTKCSEVLNKMIVNCMEAYSLISFVALNCFNLLQP